MKKSSDRSSDEEVDLLIRIIQDNLSPDLLKKQYRERNRYNPMYGHCYVATETLYHILKDTEYDKDFKPCWGKDDEGNTHWWLESEKDGEILDVTVDQYRKQGKNPPYSIGRKGTFLTKEPSKRSKELMERINSDLDNDTGVQIMETVLQQE